MGKKTLPLLAGGAAAILAIKALDNRINTAHYKVCTDKLSSNIRIALVTDLHCKKRANPHTRLVNMISENAPDVVLLGGDIIEGEVDFGTEITFLKNLADKFPCFYVSGNHEYYKSCLSRTKKVVSHHGITVLDGKCETLAVKDDKINIGGVDDADTGHFKAQLESVNPIDTSLFSVLLSHKPHFPELFAKLDFDLVLSGHTHGGQWRLPHVIDGVYASGQGIFPKYTGGEYKNGRQTIIIGRGVSSSSSIIPRIFNPPELVFIDICPL